MQAVNRQTGGILVKLLIVLAVLAALVLAALYYVIRPAEVASVDIEALAERQAAAFDTSLPTFEAIPQSDLPPEGTRSLFDHMIAENGALPYPFEQLVDLIASYDREGAKPPQVMIPDGRSLLKGFADFNHPRVIVAANPRSADSDGDLGMPLKGRLFITFVEDANEIELISYNEQAGRFEFQLVKEYCEGCVPRIAYAPRALCLTCHQSQGPIFPVRPWEETNGQRAIADRIAATRETEKTDVYAGGTIGQPLSAPEKIDDLTDIGNVIPTVQRVWIDGCGLAGDECRRLMLELALYYLWNPGDITGLQARLPELAALQEGSWPARGIPLNNNDLNNRNPLDEPPQGFWATLRSWMSDGTEASKPRSGDTVAEFSKLPPLPPHVDPLTARDPKLVLKPGSADAVTGLAQMFSRNDQRLLEKHSGYSFENIQSAVKTEAVMAELGLGPFRRVPIMQALLRGLGVENPPGSVVTDTTKMSPPMLDGAEPLEISEGSVLKIYEKYCFACHRGNPNAELNFMAGETEVDVMAQIEETQSILDVLDYERYAGTAKAGQLMPPSTAYQRALLEKNMNEAGNDLSEMREAVPSLFDF